MNISRSFVRTAVALMIALSMSGCANTDSFGKSANAMREALDTIIYGADVIDRIKRRSTP